MMKLSVLLSALAFSSYAIGSPSNIGILGGYNRAGTEPPFAFLVSESGSLKTLDLFFTTGRVTSTAMNNFGSGIIGGWTMVGGPPFAYLVSNAGVMQSLDLSSITNASVSSVAINDFGIGLIGGGVNGGDAFAYLVSPQGGLTSLSLPANSQTVQGVALNNSGAGLIAGWNVAPNTSYAVLASSNGSAVPLALPSNNVVITAVDMNESGLGIIGANEPGVGPIVSYLVSPQGNVTSINFPSVINGSIEGVAINNFGLGLIGGITNIYGPIAYFVNSSGALQSINLPSDTAIASVAINDYGVGILGGEQNLLGNGPPVAYLVNSNGTVTTLNFPPAITSGQIVSVAINEYGVGLIAGEDSLPTQGPPIAFLVSPTGTLTSLVFPPWTASNGAVISVALNALSHIPTGNLSGNNLVFANFINDNAPFYAYYFVPSVLDGTLPLSLESAAPTRNAFALYTADNNLLALNNSLSRHSQNSRYKRHSKVLSETLVADAEQTVSTPDSDFGLDHELLSGDLATQEKQPVAIKENRPYQLWGELIGAVAYQNEEHQAPKFQPSTGGAIVGFDAQVSGHSWCGGGAAYTFTHIHENNGYGYSHINQEYLFCYGLWDSESWYGDFALWGGFVQVKNVRDIKMAGFQFTSTSHPKGFQLAPHAEVGYDYDFYRNGLLEPFVMLDWISNWQRSYQESGSSPFNAGQNGSYSSFLRTELGIRFYEIFGFTNWRLTMKEKASYVNKKPFQVGTVKAFLVGVPGTFTVETLTTPQNLGAIELQMLCESINPRYPYGSLSYQGEFGSMYQSHQVAVDICWNF